MLELAFALATSLLAVVGLAAAAAVLGAVSSAVRRLGGMVCDNQTRCRRDLLFGDNSVEVVGSHSEVRVIYRIRVTCGAGN